MMYIAAFLAAIIEGTIVLAFVPGSTFILSLGVFAANGDLSIGLLFIIVIIGAFLGDNLGYLIGKLFGLKILELNIVDKTYYNFSKAFIKKHGKKSIFFARFISVIKEVAPFTAGILRMEKKSFVIWNFLGGICWSFLWLGSGYWFGQNLESITDILKGIATFGLIGFSLLMVSYYFKHKDELDIKEESDII